jgi:hypothetical protein
MLDDDYYDHNDVRLTNCWRDLDQWELTYWRQTQKCASALKYGFAASDTQMCIITGSLAVPFLAMYLNVLKP